ncbi:MAG: flavodoxin family protein, partial [Frankiaceae bacterium]
MRAIVVYESIYGNTHTVADHIAAGLRPTFDVTVVPVGEATRELVSEADLLVVGGPTHAHGMTRRGTRKSGVDAGLKSDDLSVDPDAEGPGLRDWL